MQFRKNEIDRLNEVLQVSVNDRNDANFILLLSHSGITVNNFLKSKLVIFGLNEDTEIAKKLQALNDEIEAISKEYLSFQLYSKNFENLKNQPDANNRVVELGGLWSIMIEGSKNMTKHFGKAMELKTSIIKELQKITLGETIP